MKKIIALLLSAVLMSMCLVIGLTACGKNGQGSTTPTIEIGSDGYWYINGTKTAYKAEGEKGEKGDKGENGKDGIDGSNGENGKDGKSAYELYKEIYGYEGTEEEWLDDLVNGRLAGKTESGEESSEESSGESGESETGSESTTPSKKTDFTLQIFTGGYGSEMWEYVLKEFEKGHPEYNVIANMGKTVNDAMQNEWRDGNPPDFVFLDGTLEKQAWLENDMLYDFTDWLETATVAGEENVKIKERVIADYAHKYTNNEGKTITYGMPLLVSSYGMWHDETFFKHNVWTVPKNYNELLAWIDNNAAANMAALIYPGVYSGYLVQGMILPALAEVGDSFYNRVENALDAEVYTSAEFKAVMNRFATIVGKQNAVADCLSLNHLDSQMRWLNHKAAFIPNGLWLRSEMADLEAIPDGFNMRYTPSALNVEKQVVVASSITCAVAKDAKNKEAALEFMRYLYRTDVAQKFAECSDSPSATNVILDGTKISDVLKYAQEEMNNPAYKRVLHMGSWGRVESVFNQGVNSIVAGTKTVDQVCNELAAQAKRQLAER